MEFWGYEVKAGQPIKTDPGANHVIHVSQASLGESKHKAESVPLYVNVNGKKHVLGTLSLQNCPQLSFDLVFEQDFEISHNWKNGNRSSDEEISEDEELPVAAAENGKAKADAGNKAFKVAEPSNNKKDGDEDDSNSEDESDYDEDDSEDETSMDGSSGDEDEETPKKVELMSKKRPAEVATPVSAKKAKTAATPQKTGFPHAVHSKMVRRAVTQRHRTHQSRAGKLLRKAPSLVFMNTMQITMNTSFGSEDGLESHKKAKHGGK
ncbi:Histone deacetylase HDT1 [Hibiscus syriacus]|uniref:Histone deacetylase HDT1 n=1 Tax=Hibiscus syriacus TaxID=106335 RepID=A0A6A2ZGE4_HIBSY|nr:Histone deacetylase HDT1 [Hibiscus syriacus]